MPVLVARHRFKTAGTRKSRKAIREGVVRGWRGREDCNTSITYMRHETGIEYRRNLDRIASCTHLGHIRTRWKKSRKIFPHKNTSFTALKGTTVGFHRTEETRTVLEGEKEAAQLRPAPICPQFQTCLSWRKEQQSAGRVRQKRACRRERERQTERQTDAPSAESESVCYLWPEALPCLTCGERGGFVAAGC